MKKLCLLFVLIFSVSAIFAFEDSDTLSFDTFLLNKNDTLLLAAIKINIPQDYHLYSNPKGPGVGRDLKIEGLDYKDLVYLYARKQPPKVFLPPDEPETDWVWAWEESAVIFIAMTAQNFDIAEILLEGVYCKTSCVPFSEKVTIRRTDREFDENLLEIYESSENIPMIGALQQEEDYNTADINFNVKNASGHSLLSAILLAFLAGIILNFMPCVLPILGIKILSFSVDGDKKTAILRSFAFAFGIILVFLILAILAVQLKIWWGQQFQNPIFITALAVLMIIGALFLFDVFVFSPNSKIANLEMKQSKASFFGNFVRGICATILATPCSGPFFGAILAWALIDNSNFAVFAVFLSVGVGMSAPYVFLSFFGGVNISRKIAKHSLLIKKILGVVLLLFAGYLLLFANFNRFFTKTQSGVWIEFSQELFEEAQKNGQSLIVEFTAKWCLNCQYNKIAVYETKEIHQVLQEKNILALTADLTNENVPAQNLQARLNSRSIPFLAIFDGNDFENPVIFYDIVSKRAILEVLERVK